MKNILLITIDCLRADHISSYGYKRKTTPFFDKLTKKGVKFNYAFSTGSSTPYSFPALMASIHPLDYTNIPSLNHPNIRSIASILKKYGYITVGVHSNVYVSKYYGYDNGFLFFYDLESKQTKRKIKFENKLVFKLIKSNKHIEKFFKYILSKLRFNHGKKKFKIPYANAKKTTNFVIEWLSKKDNKSPVFLWVHYMDPHHPFLPNKYLKNFNEKAIDLETSFKLDRKLLEKPDEINEEEHKLIIDLYDAEIRMLDDHLKRLYRFWNLKFPNSTIIITSDHGEEFYEHGDFSHKAKLYDELIHVPLLIIDPSVKPRESNDLISLIDLPPTILDLNKLPNYEYYKGQSLFSANYQRREYIICETKALAEKVSMEKAGNHIICVRSKRWKYIKDDKGNKQLFDLKNDMRELKNIAEEKPILIKELDKIIEIHKKGQEKIKNN